MLIPGIETGQIRVENLTNNTSISGHMHENPLVCVSINAFGTIGASSSEYGTVIRVFTCENLAILHELRRGTISARISSIIFNKDSTLLIAGSNKNTIHI